MYKYTVMQLSVSGVNAVVRCVAMYIPIENQCDGFDP